MIHGQGVGPRRMRSGFALVVLSALLLSHAQPIAGAEQPLPAPPPEASPLPLAGPPVLTQGLASWVEGQGRIQPAQGEPGTGLAFHYWPYNLPGEFIKNGTTITDPGSIATPPFDIAYANHTPGGTQGQPVQTTDWWSSVGLQWPGWVQGADPANPVVRTPAIINEPLAMQFLDLPDEKRVAGLDLPVQGLRFFSQVDINVYTGSPNTVGNRIARGGIADERSAILTVGLAGVHPIAASTPNLPQQPPYTNIRVTNYSDWGVEMAYADGDDELSFTMANGSPFVWAERTKGNAPFRVWAGKDDTDPNGQLSVWYNQNGTLGLNLTTSYVPPDPLGAPQRTSSAAYVVYADAGSWTEQRSTKPNAQMSLFSNPQATRVVVLALPHNLPLTDTAALTAALTELQPYAWQRISATQLHYPPIPGSDTSVNIGGVAKPLGYDRASSTLRLRHAVTTEPFKSRLAAGPALQMVFPHHRKAMIAQDRQNILQANGQPKYSWRSLKGELQAYVGNSYVRELRVEGVLPFLPSTAIDDATRINGEIPAEDVYQALKHWYYQNEPVSPGLGSFNSVVRDLGPYLGYAQNTYAPGLAALFESLTIADQLANSPGLTGDDDDLEQRKRAAAAEIRDGLLASLKELVGRWADVYSAGLFQYHSDYNTFVGYPEGYESVQNLNDKHFHWGYFLRSAAVIGRYDPAWLQAYLPLFDQLRADVANYDRSSSRYPFLRNFSPFYGHSWADGTANGGVGQNQESTSEAINFAAGLIDLGQVLGNREWVDIGIYLYEEEVLGVEQYWFNQDANLAASSGSYYNGNWPDAFVRYQRDGQTARTLFIDQVFQEYVWRGTFFSNDTSSSLAIQALPLSASGLYIGRNQAWLAALWQQYQQDITLDPAATSTPYELAIAGVQAQLGGSDAAIGAPGPLGALTRVDNPHKPFFGTVNAMAKHWAYTLEALGQVDTSVVADLPSYGVFCKGATGARCAGGTRSFVAYNPGAAPLTVTFRDATSGAVVTTLRVPAGSLASKGGTGSNAVDRPTPSQVRDGRLYLRKGADISAACSELPSATLELTTTPGNWRPASGTVAFPSDTSALNDSIVCVPGRPDLGTPNIQPAPGFVRTWSGTFSGTLEREAVTHFAIHTNQSLFPGWQRDPCVQGGPAVQPPCPSAALSNPYAGGNVMTMYILYDFNSDGEQDRIEQYYNMPLSEGNAWSYANKQTDYRFSLSWPNLPPPVAVVGSPGKNPDPFPESIPADAPATVTLVLFGGSTDPRSITANYAVPVSVNADPLTDRASWVRPPYGVPQPPAPEELRRARR
jgi:hypothetical protein